MDIKRVEGSFDMYRITATKGEIDTIKHALESAPGAEADELLGAFEWYEQMLPGPGETKEQAKERQDGEDGGDKVPVGGVGDDDIDAEADRMIMGDGADLPGGAEPPMDDLGAEVDALLPEPGGDTEIADIEVSGD